MKTKIVIAVFVLFSTLVSCKKAEKGDMGPTGPAGSNGSNGNANVKMFYFGKDSITTARTTFILSLTVPSVTSNMMDSSAILVYHLVTMNNGWYATPGLGYVASYESRLHYFSSTRQLIVSVYNPDGTVYSGSQVNISKFKVVLIPSSDYKGSRKKPVDFNNYEETMKYYGLPLD